MDLSQLQNILLHTFSTNNQLRKQAEDAIAQLATIPNTLQLLLQILQQPKEQRELRQASSIVLKNFVQKQWIVVPNHPDNQTDADGIQLIGIPDHEKEMYRTQILQCLFSEQDNSIRSIVAECISTIARIDFPPKWPALVDEICTTLQSGDPIRMYNALLALRTLVRVFEFKNVEHREPLNAIVVVVFPLLHGLFTSLLQNYSLESGQMLHLICKIYYSAVQFHIPLPILKEPESSLTPWITVFQSLLALKLPEAHENREPKGQPIDEEDRNEWPWWKCKKWILKICFRFQHRWGNPKQVKENAKEISMFIRNQMGTGLFQTIMELLALRTQGLFCTDRVVQLSLSWISGAVEPSVTYKLIKPHFSFLLFQVLHPLLCLTPKDLQLWQEDPHEFVRKSHDFFEDNYYNPTMAASGLLTDLAKKRGKDCIVEIVNFYNERLQSYAAKKEKTFEDFIQKDATLHAFYALASVLSSPNSMYFNSLEQLIRDHVIPEFQNPHGFLRLRACRMFSRHFIDNIIYQDQSNLVNILQGVLNCMQDNELPVKIEAAKTLKTLVIYKHSDVMLNGLRPILPQVLEQYFKLMDEIGNDEVVCALETIIDQFGDEIGPFSLQLIEKLTECFQQFAGAGEDDDDAAMVALQCLDAINTILMSIHQHPELYEVIGNHLAPLIKKILCSNNTEYLDSAMEILCSLTFYSRTIFKTLWALFPYIFACFSTFGWDCLSSFVPVIDNFVGRDVEGFVQGHFITDKQETKSYVELLFLMIQRVLGDANDDEIEICSACRLLCSVLHNCFQRVDAWIPTIVTLIVNGLAQPSTDSVRAQYLKIVASLFYYNPKLTLDSLHRANATEAVFKLWLGNGEATLARVKSVFDKKLLCLGLTALARLPMSDLPPILQGNIKPIIMQTAQILQIMIQQEQSNATSAFQEQKESTTEFGSKIPEGGYDSCDDVEDGDDHELYAELLKGIEKDPSFLYGYDIDDDDDDYTSGLDAIDPVIFFIETIDGKVTSDPQNFGHIEQELGTEFSGICQTLTAEANRRRQATISN